MNAILSIQTQLDSANERVLLLEQAQREYPGNPSIAANLDSAVRVRQKLREQLEAATKSEMASKQ